MQTQIASAAPAQTLRLHTLADVAKLLGRSYATILTIRSRSPELLPRTVKVGKALLVFEDDLNEFLQSRACATHTQQVRSGRGRPHWKEVEEAKAAGLTVKELRARKAHK